MADESQALVEEQELTIDDLYGDEIDQESFKKVQSSTLLPNGSYTTNPPFNPQIRKDKTGRVVINFFGEIIGADSRGNEIKGRIGVRFSPVARNAINRDTGEDLGKPDRLTKNYVLAMRAYKTAHADQDCPNVGELVAYLRDYPVRLRIGEFNGDNMVYSISAVRPPV